MRYERGCKVRWYGKGCSRKNKKGKVKRFGDGGCQARDYCGFKCEDRCSKQSKCIWHRVFNVCGFKTFAPSVLPTTLNPTQNPVPTTSPIADKLVSSSMVLNYAYDAALHTSSGFLTDLKTEIANELGISNINNVIINSISANSGSTILVDFTIHVISSDPANVLSASDIEAAIINIDTSLPCGVNDIICNHLVSVNANEDDSTLNPTRNPTTLSPSSVPSSIPTGNPTSPIPTLVPTKTPTKSPTTPVPTLIPTKSPTKLPTKSPVPPTTAPTTSSPITISPTVSPTKLPSTIPTNSPTSVSPTLSPTLSPSKSINPTNNPTQSPTYYYQITLNQDCGNSVTNNLYFDTGESSCNFINVNSNELPCSYSDCDGTINSACNVNILSSTFTINDCQTICDSIDICAGFVISFDSLCLYKTSVPFDGIDNDKDCYRKISSGFPTLNPSISPTRAPTIFGETFSPTIQPTNIPSTIPSIAPTTLTPTVSPVLVNVQCLQLSTAPQNGSLLLDCCYFHSTCVSDVNGNNFCAEITNKQCNNLGSNTISPPCGSGDTCPSGYTCAIANNVICNDNVKRCFLNDDLTAQRGQCVIPTTNPTMIPSQSPITTTPSSVPTISPSFDYVTSFQQNCGNSLINYLYFNTGESGCDMSIVNTNSLPCSRSNCNGTIVDECNYNTITASFTIDDCKLNCDKEPLCLGFVVNFDTVCIYKALVPNDGFDTTKDCYRKNSVILPTLLPSVSPSQNPTLVGQTFSPTFSPSIIPSASPSNSPQLLTIDCLQPGFPFSNGTNNFGCCSSISKCITDVNNNNFCAYIDNIECNSYLNNTSSPPCGSGNSCPTGYSCAIGNNSPCKFDGINRCFKDISVESTQNQCNSLTTNPTMIPTNIPSNIPTMAPSFLYSIHYNTYCGSASSDNLYFDTGETGCDMSLVNTNSLPCKSSDCTGTKIAACNANLITTNFTITDCQKQCDTTSLCAGFILNYGNACIYKNNVPNDGVDVNKDCYRKLDLNLPTLDPTSSPTKSPTFTNQTTSPTNIPTNIPSISPSKAPSIINVDCLNIGLPLQNGSFSHGCCSSISKCVSNVNNVNFCAFTFNKNCSISSIENPPCGVGDTCPSGYDCAISNNEICNNDGIKRCFKNYNINSTRLQCDVNTNSPTTLPTLSPSFSYTIINDIECGESVSDNLYFDTGESGCDMSLVNTNGDPCAHNDCSGTINSACNTNTISSSFTINDCRRKCDSISSCLGFVLNFGNACLYKSNMPIGNSVANIDCYKKDFIGAPTDLPTLSPTLNPTLPTTTPTLLPSMAPQFTFHPTTLPTNEPTKGPTVKPSAEPTMAPTKSPGIFNVVCLQNGAGTQNGTFSLGCCEPQSHCMTNNNGTANFCAYTEFAICDNSNIKTPPCGSGNSCPSGFSCAISNNVICNDNIPRCFPNDDQDARRRNC